MEYELFRSKLKPSVDGALISGIFRSSSSGLSSHRTAVMELIIEGSIQERRQRMFEKTKNSSRSDPTPQTRSISVAPKMTIPEVRHTAPAPAPQPPSKSSPNGTTGTVTCLASAPAERKVPQDSSALPGPTKKIEGAARSEKPPVDVKTNPSPSEDFVELECNSCHSKRSRSYPLSWGTSCMRCLLAGKSAKMKCVGCGTIWVDDVDACTGCHRTFK